MKFRRSYSFDDKVEIQMAPMIDVVFQLLIFFMLTLKIIPPEGDFSINMPLGPAKAADNTEIQPVKLILTLKADGNGFLREMRLGNTPFPIPAAEIRSQAEDALFLALNGYIGNFMAKQEEGQSKDIELEIRADYNLHSKYTIKAIDACSGKLMKTKDGTVAPKYYIKNIKFSRPKSKKSPAKKKSA